MSRARMIGRRFGAAARDYEDAAGLQRVVAQRLADRVVGGCAADGQPPQRILELGCGTGLLTRALRRAFPDALIVATDLAPEMVRACRQRMPDDSRLLVLAMDAGLPAVQGGFDVVCSSLALQWAEDPVAVLIGLMPLMAPGGRLAVATLADGTLAEWRESCASEGVIEAGLAYPTLDRLRQSGLAWGGETVLAAHADAIGFLRQLRCLGATTARDGTVPQNPVRLRRALLRLQDEHAATISWCIAYGMARRPKRPGVFVAGTDTGIGKTLVAACLVTSWAADYWKPLQTGLDEESGDSDTVRALSGCEESAIHPPALALRAPLSPEDAAALEGARLDWEALSLPLSARGPGRPLVVEGAGGVLVPLDGTRLTTALIERLGLPVLLVARSTLGTINHTLLSLQALRARGIEVWGVVLSGPLSPGNRSAIERHGRVRVLAELQPMPPPDRGMVARLAPLMPPPPVWPPSAG